MSSTPPTKRTATGGLRAQLAVVPGTGHGLFAEKPALCNRIVIDFLEEQP